MRVLSKELVSRYQAGRNVVPGFLTYISPAEPALMHCYGWQDYSDAYDDYVITELLRESLVRETDGDESLF